MKTITIILCLILTICASLTSFAGKSSWNRNWSLYISDNDEIVEDEFEGCLLKLREYYGQIPPKKEFLKLKSLYKKLIKAALNNDIDAYKQCFLNPAKLNSQTIRKEIKRLSKAYNNWHVRQCMWGIKKVNNNKIYLLVFATTDEKFNADDMVPHLRRIMYAKEQNGKLLFIRNYHEKQLEKLIRNELYPSIVTYTNRPLRERKLIIQFKKNKKKLLEKQDRLDNFNECFFSEENGPIFKKLGYTKKEMWKLFNESREYCKQFDDWHSLSEKPYTLEIQYAVKKGIIKIYEKPILIKNFLTADKPLIQKPKTFLDRLYLEVYENAHIPDRPNTETAKDYYGNIILDENGKPIMYGGFVNEYKKYKWNYFQLWGYSIMKFRDAEYCTLTGILYSKNKENNIKLKHYNFYAITENGKRKFYTFEDIAINTHILDPGTPIEYKSNKWLEIVTLKTWIPDFFPEIERIIMPGNLTVRNIPRKDYEQKINAIPLKEFFSIKPESECLPYTPGMEFTDPPIKNKNNFSFKELEAAFAKTTPKP